jgi:hypothetical protein
VSRNVSPHRLCPPSALSARLRSLRHPLGLCTALSSAGTLGSDRSPALGVAGPSCGRGRAFCRLGRPCVGLAGGFGTQVAAKGLRNGLVGPGVRVWPVSRPSRTRWLSLLSGTASAAACVDERSTCPGSIRTRGRRRWTTLSRWRWAAMTYGPTCNLLVWPATSRSRRGWSTHSFPYSARRGFDAPGHSSDADRAAAEET